MTELKWRELVDKTRQGDTKAFEELYNETKRSVYFTALKMLANEENAKDVMQETFITAIEKLSDLNDGANFPKWINTIAVNKCRRYFRKQSEDSLDEQSEQGFEIKDDESFIPEEYVSNEVKRKVIMDIISNSLSDVQRQTIIMYYYNEMSLEDIADVMDSPVKTVSSRLCSAREKIREAVLIYEKKQGDRLHAVVPVPILAMILRMEAEKLSVPDIPLEFFTKILIDAVSKATAANAAAGTGAGTSAAVGTAAGSAAAGTVSSAGGAVTSMISGKIIAGIIAVTIAGGGTAAVIHSQNKQAEEKQASSKVEVSVSETVTEMPITTTEATGWICDECGIVNYGKFCSNCGKPKPSNAETVVPSDSSESSGSTESAAPYEYLNRELDPEMKAKRDELRANGAETVEVKWGTQNPIPFTEYSTGEEVGIRFNGKFTYFPEVNGDMDEDTLKAYVIDSMSSVILHRSGYFDAEQLPHESGFMRDEVIAMLANEHGILLDRLNIESITTPKKTETEKAAQTTTVQSEDKPEETTTKASSGKTGDKTPEMFFEAGYNKASTYPIIYMLPKGNGKKGGEGLVQLQNTGKAQWEEFDAPGTEAKDQKLLKRYNMKFGGIEPDYRKPGMAPADEIKDYLMNGYDRNSLHVNAFGRLMDLIDAKETTVKIDTITSEKKVELLGSEAYKIKGYFTYDPKRGDETVKCYFSAFFGTFDYEYDPSGNMAGGLPFYMVIAYTSGEFADDEVQQAQCDQLIDTSIKGIYYVDDPNAPEV